MERTTGTKSLSIRITAEPASRQYYFRVAPQSGTPSRQARIRFVCWRCKIHSRQVQKLVRIQQGSAQGGQPVFAHEAQGRRQFVGGGLALERQAKRSPHLLCRLGTGFALELRCARKPACCRRKRLFSKFSACKAVVELPRRGAIWPPSGQSKEPNDVVELHPPFALIDHAPPFGWAEVFFRVVDFHIVVFGSKRSKPGPPIVRSSLPLTNRIRVAQRFGFEAARRISARANARPRQLGRRTAACSPVLRPSALRLSIGRRQDDEPVQRLDPPAADRQIRVANQSNNSGCDGLPPLRPKSLGVLTRPAPKWCCQRRLTRTRAVSGLLRVGDPLRQRQPALGIGRIERQS